MPHLPLASLEFLSSSMLGWLVVAVLPVVVHYLYRRQHQTTSWAAVQLLLAAVEQSGPKIRLQQWLLLAVRTALLLLVALAAAEPVWREGPSTALVHRVLVLDQSYSMRYREEGMTRFERAQAACERLIAGADAITILAWDAQVQNVIGRPTPDASLARTVVQGLEPSCTTANLAAAVEGIQAVLRTGAEGAVPQVFFLTDLGQNSWDMDAALPAQWVQLAAAVTVIDVGQGAADNLAITTLESTPALIVRQQEVRFSATVENYGVQEYADLTLEWLIDGQRVSSQNIAVPAGGRVPVDYVHTFLEAGEATVEVRLADEVDGLALDNQRWRIARVQAQQRVACVAGRPRAAADVARTLAFAPKLLAPEILPASHWERLRLATYDTVVLASVDRLSASTAARLTRYVAEGGALIVLLDGTTPLGDLLPVKILGLQSAGTYRLDPVDYAHPILHPFRQQTRAGLSQVLVSRYVRLQQDATAQTVLAFDTGDPALVVARQGLGCVAVWALPATLSTRESKAEENVGPWSSLALSPIFLPLMRELLTHLLEQRLSAQTGFLPGETIPGPRLPPAHTAPLTMRLPMGKSLPVNRTERPCFAETRQVGVYTMQTGNQVLARYAVNLATDGSPNESQLSSVRRADLPATALIKTQDSPLQRVRGEVPLARWLLAGAGLLLVVELTLAWMLGRAWA